ncbi:hypothetical protein, partial [Pseudomonas sp. MPR-R2A5]|uniref:hypothetical protein n=1 Tax=Pseudomonas sp. MPR-R2A5 TaxID=2070622 RepID=UPI0011AFC5C2
MAFDLTDKGTYHPQRLSDLHARHCDSDEPDRRRTADEARDAFEGVDWSKASAFTNMRWLANPWGFDHRTGIDLFGDAQDG